MDSWRRQKGDNYSQEVRRPRSRNKKPPLGIWQPTVPSWEKKFCNTVGLIKWQKILETKKFMHLFEKVVKWNDSAGEEAFHNAKNRFYANIHGIPCDISLPDPDIYIDEVDWDSVIDPELLDDLECEAVVPEADENVVIFGNALIPNQGFSSTGWGESDEDLKKAINSSLDNNNNQREGNCSQNIGGVNTNGWGDFGNNSWCWNDDTGGAMGYNGWEDGWNNSCGLNQYEKNNYEDLKNGSNYYQAWGINNNGNREDTGGYMSRYKTSRFDNQRNHMWRNGKGSRRRGNFVSEQSTRTSPSQQWNLINSCGPVNHHVSGEAGQTWTLEKKPVF